LKKWKYIYEFRFTIYEPIVGSGKRFNLHDR
jgi:hypothetical protein